jgi:hypothetical protein
LIEDPGLVDDPPSELREGERLCRNDACNKT